MAAPSTPAEELLLALFAHLYRMGAIDRDDIEQMTEGLSDEAAVLGAALAIETEQPPLSPRPPLKIVD